VHACVHWTSSILTGRHVWCIPLLRAGYGGGFMERDEVVEYIERSDSDDEFDEVICPIAGIFTS